MQRVQDIRDMRVHTGAAELRGFAVESPNEAWDVIGVETKL